MREIKYKFYDKELKKMCERKPAYNDFTHPNIVPLQYTGLKDCEGKEIYEGDKLIDIEVTLEEGVQLVDTAQQVYWCVQDACFKLDHTFKQNKTSGDLLAKELRDFKFKAVGSVYDVLSLGGVVKTIYCNKEVIGLKRQCREQCEDCCKWVKTAFKG